MTPGTSPAAQRASPARFGTALVVGILLGVSLGVALILSIGHLELSGDRLLSFALGSLLTLGGCLVIGGVAALLIVPRLFANARGTLAGMVNDLTEASRAHACGNSDQALQLVGRAAEEGVAWYSIRATHRFVTQAALGLLISFGGIIGAVLLFSQNTLLREQNQLVGSQVQLLRVQNKMAGKQVRLLAQQNKKIDDQVRLSIKQTGLIRDQNRKIDQQTMVADAQKRGAFATELFAIVQELAKLKQTAEGKRRKQTAGLLPRDLVARIVVLTSSAVPYVYLDFESGNIDASPKRISKPLSPERGLIIAALARMKVDLPALHRAGARFDRADLRGVELDEPNFSTLRLGGSDFTGAKLFKPIFDSADLSEATFSKTEVPGGSFNGTLFYRMTIRESNFDDAKFERVMFNDVTFSGGSIQNAKFVGVITSDLEFVDVSIGKDESDFPKGLDWPKSTQQALLQSLTNDPDSEVRLTMRWSINVNDEPMPTSGAR